MLDLDEAKTFNVQLPSAEESLLLVSVVEEYLLIKCPPRVTSPGSTGQQLCTSLCWTQTSGVQGTGNGLIHGAEKIH